jgi:hypothetical protein
MHNVIEVRDLKTAKAINAIAVFVLFIPVLLWHAFVFSTLWRWFIADPFRVVTLSLPHALGLLFVWRFLSARSNRVELKTADEVIERLGWWLADVGLWPLLLLIAGAVVRGLL